MIALPQENGIGPHHFFKHEIGEPLAVGAGKCLTGGAEVDAGGIRVDVEILAQFCRPLFRCCGIGNAVAADDDTALQVEFRARRPRLVPGGRTGW
ncbi:MAG: hypothetical protein U5P41_09405 [Gammaproteobacteria bacterium]|nr:hypothetical protein [Gammaproteobacteria bacterium]